jgi:hypothetical protein
MADAAGLFLTRIYKDDEFHPLSAEEKRWAKTLYESDENSPGGLPFRVRKNHVIEFRWLKVRDGFDDYKKAARGFETFVHACGAIAAWQKVHDQDANITEKDRKLAAVWDRMKAQALNQLQLYGIPNAKFDYFFTNAEELSHQIKLIRNCVATHHRSRSGIISEDRLESNRIRRQAMYNVFREGRREIKRILQEETIPVGSIIKKRG